MKSLDKERLFALRARLALGIHGHRVPGLIRRLHAMLDTPRLIGDIPMIGRAARRDGLAATHGVGVTVGTVASHIGADRRAGNSTADGRDVVAASAAHLVTDDAAQRSEEHTSELQSRLVISYAVFC